MASAFASINATFLKIFIINSEVKMFGSLDTYALYTPSISSFQLALWN